MPIGNSICPRRTSSIGLHFMICLSLLCGVALSPAQQNQAQPIHPSRLAYAADPANIPDAVDKVRSGDFAAVHLEMIASAHATEAIPPLEEQFAKSRDPLTTAKIASVLVRLGDSKTSYWDFLVKQATLAIESPNPSLLDADGKQVRGSISPQFTAWANASGLPPDPVYIIPALVGMLGETGDTRAIPLLRRGLLSPNPFIEAEAARGLATIRDSDSIPLIIDSCQKAPDWGAAIIAKSLVYFDDPNAQKAVDVYIPADMAKVYRAGRAMGTKP